MCPCDHWASAPLPLAGRGGGGGNKATTPLAFFTPPLTPPVKGRGIWVVGQFDL